MAADAPREGKAVPSQPFPERPTGHLSCSLPLRASGLALVSAEGALGPAGEPHLHGQASVPDAGPSTVPAEG